MESIFGFIIVGYIFYEFTRLLKSAIKRFIAKIKSCREKRDADIENRFAEALENKTFGDFTLSQAVIIFRDSSVIPREGFRVFTAEGNDDAAMKQVLISVSTENLFDIVDELLKALGDIIHFSFDDYRSDNGEFTANYVYDRDGFIIRSMLLDIEELIVNNGSIGLAAFSPVNEAEIRLNQEKIISVTAKDITPFASVLIDNEIDEVLDLGFIWDDEYLLMSKDADDETIDNFVYSLNADKVVVYNENEEEK